MTIILFKEYGLRKIIAIVGDSKIEEGSLKEKLAFETGKALIDAGYRIQSGGLGGIMRAVFKGAHASDKYREGDTLAILPSFDASTANEYSDIVIPTGLDLYRNTIVAGASAVVAIGGGSGTLSEIANAWAMNRLILAYKNVDGWSARLADTALDNRQRNNGGEDKIIGVESAAEVVKALSENLARYSKGYRGIPEIFKL